MIYPTNQILEDYTLHYLINSRMAARDKKLQNLKYYLQNLSRVLVCITAVYLAIKLQEKLDKFLSVLGALLCAPLAITYPALIHLRIVSVTTREKLTNLFLVALSALILILCTSQSISAW